MSQRRIEAVWPRWWILDARRRKSEWLIYERAAGLGSNLMNARLRTFGRCDPGRALRVNVPSIHVYNEQSHVMCVFGGFVMIEGIMESGRTIVCTRIVICDLIIVNSRGSFDYASY